MMHFFYKIYVFHSTSQFSVVFVLLTLRFFFECYFTRVSQLINGLHVLLSILYYRYDNEINPYYNKHFGTFNQETGHFTQVVWKNTKRVGCALSRKGDHVVVVCRYDPPGNFLGLFETQVGGRL